MGPAAAPLAATLVTGAMLATSSRARVVARARRRRRRRARGGGGGRAAATRRPRARQHARGVPAGEPARRAPAARSGRDEAHFDAMVRRGFAPMLDADDYAVHARPAAPGATRAVVDVLLFRDGRRVAGYAFRMARVADDDAHAASGRTRCAPTRRSGAPTRHRALAGGVRASRAPCTGASDAAAARCFGASWRSAALQHSFGVDATHNLCCGSGRTRGRTRRARATRSATRARACTGGPLSRWSTCMGSNVCGAYAAMRCGPRALFATTARSRAR